MMNYESFLQTSLAKYQNADFTKNEVLGVISVFSDLRPKLETAELSDGSRKILLQLEGTIPVEFGGKEYRNPICVWIFDKYPCQAPDVYVRPTSTMRIRRIKNLDTHGHVCTEYIKNWKYPNSDLMGLLLDLAVVFGHEPPLTNMPSGSNWEYITKLQLENYMDPACTKQDAMSILSVFPDLRPALGESPLVNETGKPVLSLEGAMPVVYQGNIYNTPVCVHLMEQHPYQPPVVYVKPMSGMKVNESRYVDKTGRVDTPYLKAWNYPKSDLLSLIQDLTLVFGTTPPLYYNSETEQNSLTPMNNILPVQSGSSSWPSNSGNASGKNVFKKCLDRISEKMRNIRKDTAKLDTDQVPGRVDTDIDELCVDSTEDFDINCDPCKSEGSFVEAEGYCVECKEYYCKACMRYHRKIAATRKHTILLKDERPKPRGRLNTR